MIQIVKYDGNKNAKFPAKCFVINETYTLIDISANSLKFWGMLSTMLQWEYKELLIVDREDFYKYMGITESTNRKLEIIRDMIVELQKNCGYFTAYKSKKGANTYSVKPFTSEIIYHESSKTIHIHVNPRAKDFLTCKQFALPQWKFLSKLVGNYETALYLNLLFRRELKRFIIDINDIKILLGCNNQTYTHETKGTSRFLDKILGIRKDSSNPNGWYINIKTNDRRGAICGINEQTDLTVHARPVKKGKTIIGIEFDVKANHKFNKYLLKDSNACADLDMGMIKEAKKPLEQNITDLHKINKLALPDNNKSISKKFELSKTEYMQKYEMFKELMSIEQFDDFITKAGYIVIE